MNVLTVVVSGVLSVFSTAVMSYIAMATPIGPWIAPTLVLLALVIFRLVGVRAGFESKLAYVTTAGSVGGILATACGFSFPAIYFLDQPLFCAWLAQPWYFCTVITLLSFLAGWFGVWIANIMEHRLIVQEQLAFPIGQLIEKMIVAQNQVRKAYELLIGFMGTAVFCVLQDGVRSFKGIFPKTLTLVPSTTWSMVTIPQINFDLWPLLWAIGFVTGHVVAVPLAAGAFIKFFFMEPINRIWFAELPSMEFVLAFCSGLVLAGALVGLIETPKILWKAVQRIRAGRGASEQTLSSWQSNRSYVLELLLLVIPMSVFLSMMGLSVVVQAYLLLFTFICTYQMVVVAGKIGLAQLGRYATFVMVPAMFLFDLKVEQLIIIATFVELSGGVATDILFGRKLAHLAHLPAKMVRRYQYFGLIISALTVGVVFWLFINHFTLGSAELFAYKAQSRALLINVKNFNYIVLGIGFMLGMVLKQVRMNPALVLGGLLMPVNISLGLIVGGLSALWAKDKEEWFPFWSGVFASNSLWMLINTIL